MSRNTYRIGQIVPSSNTTMETEIPAMLRARESIRTERFTFHSSRMRMRNVTREELEAMNREGQRCAAELADARVDLISTACLVAIMASGLGAHRETERVPALLLEDVRRLKTANVDAVVLSACVQMQSLPSIQAAQDRLWYPSSVHCGLHHAPNA
jgi:maleate cis-trans isomerase